MTAKRKALARLQSQSSRESNEEEKETWETPQRSGSAQNTSHPDDTNNLKGVGVLPKEDEADHESVDTEVIEEEKDMAEEGVNQAIERLARMERRLQRSVKRQKLQIRESTIPVSKDTSQAAAFKPRAARVIKSSSNGSSKSDVLLTAEQDTLENEAEKKAEGLARQDGEDGADPAEAEERGAARQPPVNSDYLPLPWKGRLGYACLNTYLRNAKPPVFCSRTCRMSSIIDHRHPLQDPSKPEHSMKNRPDRTQQPNIVLGQKWVQELGLANAKDIVKMVRWNDKYGIKFMRLSSEMFPFASHQEHGYKLAPFASEALADAGKAAAELGHRLTVHPGQFTQIASPRKEVVTAAVRDLEYHDELLTLLRLPDQQDRDAVMILHMGGTYGDKPATLDRFRTNYKSLLSPSIKARLVLENDDVGWSVHDLLPICEELNIPLVLDYHHHNIVFDSAHMREGTKDISQPEIMRRITATWTRKGITQKMHYSEPCAGAVTPHTRRKHSPRVATLPPCPPNMDLMIEAKDKEQAVFELMRTFRLPGFERINDVVPHERDDESREPVRKKRPKSKGKNKKADEVDEKGDYEVVKEGREVPEQEFGMGGPLNRVYWPPGMEEWLRPQKRDIKRKVENFEDGGDM